MPSRAKTKVALEREVLRAKLELFVKSAMRGRNTVSYSCAYIARTRATSASERPETAAMSFLVWICAR